MFTRFTSLTLLLTVLFLHQATAQDKMGVTTLTGGTEQRKALLIGNRNYTHLRPLVNTERDVDAMASLLQTMGFQITSYKNLDYKASVRAIANFRNSLIPNAIALVYYSGHGIGVGGQTYLLPIDSDIQCTDDLDAYGPLSLSKLVNDLDSRKVRNSFVFLDACRNLPISTCERGKGGGTVKGLVMPTNQPKGNLIAFATREGRTSDDDTYDKTNSLFTAELLKYLATPNRDIRYIMDDVMNSVETRSQGKQRPQKTEDLGGPFVFVQTNTLDEKQVLVSPPIKPTKPQKTVPATSKKYMDLPFADMVYIPGGSFQMGDIRNEGERDERPIHEVTISPFLMGTYEVTQRQWASVMGNNPSKFKGCSDCPVEQVSWEDIQVFLEKLNDRTGLAYRLPTEAEWEYAAGGGSNTRSRFGNGNIIISPSEANFNGSGYYKKPYSVAGAFRGKTIQVGSFKPNGLGLYDMSGNVWEWCDDSYGAYNTNSSVNPISPVTGQDRMLRGGSWNYAPQNCRVTDRYPYSLTNKNFDVGFRLVSSFR